MVTYTVNNDVLRCTLNNNNTQDNSVKTKGASQSSVEIHGSLGGGGGGDEVDINVEFDLHEGLPSCECGFILIK